VLDKKVKSYGILYPLLRSFDLSDDDDCEQPSCNLKDSDKESICRPKPPKDWCDCKREHEIVFKLYIYNTCGNNNEVKVCHPQVTTSNGNVDDIKDGFIVNIAQAIEELVSKCKGTIDKLTVPIYVINVNNVLTSGSKNEICIE